MALNSSFPQNGARLLAMLALIDSMANRDYKKRERAVRALERLWRPDSAKPNTSSGISWCILSRDWMKEAQRLGLPTDLVLWTRKVLESARKATKDVSPSVQYHGWRLLRKVVETIADQAEQAAVRRLAVPELRVALESEYTMVRSVAVGLLRDFKALPLLPPVQIG